MPVSLMQIDIASLDFRGEPRDDKTERLKEDLKTVLAEEGNTRAAYLSEVLHPGENDVRLLLILDGRQPEAQMIGPIASACQRLGAIDIIFFETLLDTQISALQQYLLPFYATAALHRR